jgi:1-acyl-sn-glycerol-3-phosphate acyltransferase
LAPAPSPQAGLFPTEGTKRDFWLLWLGIGVMATLTAFEFSAFLSQFCGSFFIIRWFLLNVEHSTLLWDFFLWVIELFFREIQSRGAHKVPENSPAILAIGPHNNQFVDPIIVVGTTQ